MSGNAIEIIAKKEAVDGLRELIPILTQVDELILKVSSDALKFNQNLSGIKTPGDLAAQTTRNKASVDSMNAAMKVTDDIEKQLVVTTQKLAAASSASAKELAKVRIELANTNKEIKKEAQDVLGLVSSYDKLSAEYRDLVTNAKNLGATLGANSPEFLKAADAANKARLEIDKIDQKLGNFQRNVGNYKSGFNGLGNSINQLTRELPAFTFSAQTGFLALSNNIPILTDQIGMLIAQNKILAAEGKPITSVFKQIVSQLFSFNTVLALVILGTTLFGDKISEFSGKLFGGSKAIDAYKESTKALAEASKEATKNAAQELNALQANLAIAKNANLPIKEREIAYKNLNDQYPFYFENLTKEQVLAGQTAAAERATSTILWKYTCACLRLSGFPNSFKAPASRF